MSEPMLSEASRFARLSALLEQDPRNLNLISDAAQAAVDEGRGEEALALLDRHAAIAPLPAGAQHVAGLAEMARNNWDGAAARYQGLIDAGHDAPPVRFNLAWSLAMARRFGEALPFLDEATSAALPQAAQLEIHLLHDSGDLDQALDRAKALIGLHPDHRGLNAAISTLAIDMEDSALAERSARAAGDHPEALVTLGTLALNEDDPESAARLFDAALARNPNGARAWIGRGLVSLLGEDKARAVAELDKGAELFGSHIGSWIAAGWAHIVAGDLATGKARFETALALDDSFGETQGSLAVVDILEGRIEEGRRRAEVAARLDRQSFSTALASMLLAAGDGDKDKARRIFEIALRTPIGEDGRTLAGTLARMGTRAG